VPTTPPEEPKVITVRAVKRGGELARRDQPAPWGWTLNVHPHDGSHHVLPSWDTRVHYLDGRCACGPVLDSAGQLIHNSFDGRERHEVHGAPRH
jgi:hypothetical protein